MTPTPKNLAECQTWIKEIRPVIGLLDGRKAEQRNKEIFDLLTRMEGILKADNGKYKVTKSKEKFDALETSFKRLKKDFEDQAKAAHGNKNGDEAEKVAKQLRTLKRTARLELGKVNPTENKDVSKQLLNAARFEPVYKEGRQRFENALAKMQSMPGTKKLQDVLSRRLEEAKACEPDYKDAITALGKEMGAGGETTIRGTAVIARQMLIWAREASAELPGKVLGKTELAEFQKAEALIADYAKEAQVSEGDEIETVRTTLKGILSDAESKKLDAPGIKKAIDTLAADLKQRLADSKAARDSVEKPKKTAEAKLQEAEKSVSFAAFAVLKAEKEKAESLESCQLYDQAVQAYTTLTATIAKAITDSADGPKHWKALQDKISEMEATLKDAAAFPELNAMAIQIRTAIAKARAEVEQHKDFPAGCDAIEAAKKDAAALKKAIVAFKANNGQDPPSAILPDKDQTIQVKLARMETMLQQVVKDVQGTEIEALKKLGGDTTGLMGDCSQILKDFTKFAATQQKKFHTEYRAAKGSAAKKKYFQDALADLDIKYKAYARRIRDVGGEATAIAAKPDLLEANKDLAIKESIKKASSEGIKAIEASIAEIEALHLPADHEANALIKKINLPDLQSKADAGERVAVAIDKFKDELAAQKKKIESEIQERQKETDETVKKLNAKIDSLESGNEKHKEYFVTLRTEVAVAAGKLSSRVAAVNKKGKDKLKELDTTLDGLKQSFKDEDTNFKKVDARISDIKQQLEGVKQKDAAGHARISHEFDKVVRPKLQKLRPEDALKELAAFEKVDLAAAKDKAEDLAKKMAAFRQRATEVRKDLASSGLEKSAPALYRTLLARRDAAKESALNNLDFAHNELSAIELLRDVAKDKTKAAQLNQNSEEEEFEDKRRQAEYGAARSHCNSYMLENPEAMKARPDEYEATKKILRQADKLASATPPNFAGARESLDRAMEMARYIVDNAQDDASPLGRNLRKLNHSWKKGVSKYLKQVWDLSAELAGATPPAGHSAKTTAAHQASIDAAKKALEPLRSLFDPKAFDKYIDILEKPNADINEHRKTKEQVIVRVRRFQARLENGVLKQCVGNPISDIAIRPLRDTLRGINAQVLGS